MLCGISEACKRWFSRARHAISVKRFRSQPSNLENCKDDSKDNPPLESPATEKGLEILVEFADNKEDDTPKKSPISIVRLDVVMKETDSQIELPLRPPFLENPPETEEEFESAISEAQQYKNACAAAEDAAEEESRRRFKHFQDMYYLEKALQEKSAEAHKRLQMLFKSAREAGFDQLVPPSRVQSDGRESRASHDTIGRFMDRLDNATLEP